MAKKQINSDKRQQMLMRRRDAQHHRDGRSKPQIASHGKANMPGGERRYQARLKARDAATKA